MNLKTARTSAMFGERKDAPSSRMPAKKARGLHFRGMCLSVLVLGMGGLWIPGAEAAESLCAVVKIEIKQELTLERQAFEARMKINNGLANIRLQNIAVEVKFMDADGNSVLASSDPNNTNALFFIRQDTMKNIANVSGTGIVEPSTSAEITWLIIPSPGAGGTSLLGVKYLVGAHLTYSLAGEQQTMDVTPDYIFVKPMPKLKLDYFLPSDVYGDDAFTELIESPVPFALGVRVKNVGYGTARGVKIESAQPRIIENSLGLLVGFQITDSEVNGQPGKDMLTVDFGDIAPSRAGVARWIMECTLSGEFIHFSADFIHSDELGGKLTSLLDSVSPHLLIGDVLVDLPGRDAIRDFLAKDDGVLKVFESDAVDTPVADVSGSAVWQLVQDGTNEIVYALTLPATAGPLFAKVSYPEAEGKEVRQVVRSDGKTLPRANAWLSKWRPSGTEPWQQFFNLFDVNGGGMYKVTFRHVVPADNVAPVLQYVGRKVTRAGESLGFLVRATDANGTVPALSVSPLPAGASFTNSGSGVSTFLWTPTEGQYGVFPLRFMASDGALMDWEIIRIYVGHSGEELCNGIPCSLTNWEPEIKDLWASTLNGGATVWWDSIDGLMYEVYSANSPFAPTATWQRVGSMQEGLGTIQDQEDSTLPTNEMRRYYRLVLAGESPDERNLWGMIRKDVLPGYTLIAPPLRTDRRFDGEMGLALAVSLQGNDGGLGSGADEVYALQTNGTWRMLYLDAAGTWRESNGAESTYELPAGQGLWVVRKVGTPARITFTGPVGNDGTRTNRLNAGWNLIGLSEGRDLPLKATLATASPQGGAVEETADQLVLQNPNGSWRRLMYIQGWGAPYDGNWFDLSMYQIVTTNEVLQPGAAYYYLRRGGSTAIQY